MCIERQNANELSHLGSLAGLVVVGVGYCGSLPKTPNVRLGARKRRWGQHLRCALLLLCAVPVNSYGRG